MATKIKINKALNNYQKLRQGFSNRALADGGIYEGDTAFKDLCNEIFVDGDSLFITPTAYKAGTLYTALPQDNSGDGTVDRASTGTRINENGFIVEEAIDVPRMDWSDGFPAILCEPERTNLVLNSRDISQASYANYNGETTVTANYGVDRWGEMKAGLLSKVGGSGRFRTNFFTTEVGKKYTCTVWVRNVDLVNNRFRLKFYCGGSIATNEYDVDISSYSQWTKLEISITETVNSSSSFIQIRFDGASTGGILISDFQVEEGGYSTSTIPTANTTVTRLADQLTGFGDVGTFNDSEGTLIIKFKAPTRLQSEGRKDVFSIDNGSPNNKLYVYCNFTADNQIVVRMRVGGADQAIKVNQVDDVSDYNTVGVVYTSSTLKVFINGELKSTDTSLPSISGLNTSGFYGFNTSGLAECKCQFVKYYPVTKTDDELEKLTS